MQINPANNSNQSFKACYKAPFSLEGCEQLKKALKYEGNWGVTIYSKPNSTAKNITFFTYSFPYEHMYEESLTQALIGDRRLTKEEAEKFGIKRTLFKKSNIFNSTRLLPEILNDRQVNLKEKGINIDTIGTEQSIYVTTEEDTKAVEEYMAPKWGAHLKKYRDEDGGINPTTIRLAMNSFYPGPNVHKQNFIQRLINKHKMGMISVLLQIKNHELKASLNNENSNGEHAKKIINEINILKSQLAELSEPEYVKNVRILMDDYQQEKENFNKLFFKNREVTPVDSIEELIEKL